MNPMTMSNPVTMSHRLRTRLTAATVGLAILALTGCGGGGPPALPPPKVSVAVPVQRPVTEWETYSGRIEAVDRVDIRPRVSGHLAAMHFREGATVAKGDLLFTIDDREFRAAVDSARADLARAKARLELAERELERARGLVEAEAMSAGELELRKAELQQAKADVEASKARLRQVELTLSFTAIRAPIAGRIGAAQVKPGNVVTAQQTVLTTLVSLDPVYVAFEGDERAYLRFLRARRQGPESPNTQPLPVAVALADQEDFAYQGELVFVDNTLDPGTGTIRARALLPNPDGMLTPGLFARVRLPAGTREQALLIHEQAVLTDQDRRFVYVLGENQTAQRRDVVLGPLVDGLRVVEQGLAAEDRVIVNGMRKIFFPGQPVDPVEVAMTAPDAAPVPPSASGERHGG